ncbi:ImmA/IrrE family metallo-endopeptidase [Microbacterium esteraromaticum]|uniref:ImmA/IrrE family metallo-endopeptidase n=1 Tax=Microbacterium esteraromaticum TaxID=57043 RepID=UPI0021752143|nr:ImmA/IrrE family metallo-endopeptidase [Microbacterium esteraromaticum]
MQPTPTPRSATTRLTLPKGRAYDPWAHADALGIEVVVRRLRTANGRWFPEYNQILISDRLRAGHQRLTLAHELGHGHFGHPDDRPKFEQQADRFAASNLICPDELADLYEWCPDEQRIVAELGVTTQLFRAFVLDRAA